MTDLQREQAISQAYALLDAGLITAHEATVIITDALTGSVLDNREHA